MYHTAWLVAVQLLASGLCTRVEAVQDADRPNRIHHVDMKRNGTWTSPTLSAGPSPFSTASTTLSVESTTLSSSSTIQSASLAASSAISTSRSAALTAVPSMTGSLSLHPTWSRTIGSLTTAPPFASACRGATLNILGASLDWWSSHTYTYITTTYQILFNSNDTQTGWTAYANPTPFNVTSAVALPSCTGANATDIPDNYTYAILVCSATPEPVAASTTVISQTGFVQVNATSGLGLIPAAAITPAPAAITLPNSGGVYSAGTPFVYFSSYEVVRRAPTTYSNGSVDCRATTSSYNLSRAYAFDYPGGDVNGSVAASAGITGSVPASYLNLFNQTTATAGSYVALPTVVVVVEVTVAAVAVLATSIAAPTMVATQNGGIFSIPSSEVLSVIASTDSFGSRTYKTDVGVFPTETEVASATEPAPIFPTVEAGSPTNALLTPKATLPRGISTITPQATQPGTYVDVSGSLSSISSTVESTAASLDVAQFGPQIATAPPSQPVTTAPGQSGSAGQTTAVGSGGSGGGSGGGGVGAEIGGMVSAIIAGLGGGIPNQGTTGANAAGSGGDNGGGSNYANGGNSGSGSSGSSGGNGGSDSHGDGSGGSGNGNIAGVGGEAVVITLPPPLTVNGQTITATSPSTWIVSGQTLTPGGVITIAGPKGSQTLSLASTGSAIITIDHGLTTTSTLGAGAVVTTTFPVALELAAPPLTLGGSTFAAVNPTAGFTYVLPEDQTLSPGGPARTVTLSGQVLVLTLPVPSASSAAPVVEIETLGANGAATATSFESLTPVTTTVVISGSALPAGVALIGSSTPTPTPSSGTGSSGKPMKGLAAANRVAWWDLGAAVFTLMVVNTIF